MPQHIFSDDEMEQQNRAQISDRTAYMRWSTEVEPKKNVIDSDFLERNRISIIGLDKFAPLANFKDPRLMRLHKLKMIIIDLEIEAGLIHAAEGTALSAIDDVQISRGDNGFYQRALITQRQEVESEERTDVQKKVGFFNKMFGGKKQESQQQQGGNTQ
jgi:hypothetical protein